MVLVAAVVVVLERESGKGWWCLTCMFDPGFYYGWTWAGREWAVGNGKDWVCLFGYLYKGSVCIC